MANNWREAKLYGIVDLGYIPIDRLSEVTHQLIAGGSGLIQLRAKGHPKSQILTWAQELLPICQKANIPFIINDHIDIAVTIDADGVHLGQDDGSLKEARAQFSSPKIVGRSTHTPEQAKAALEEKADYIGFGPLFPTPTKQGRAGIGLANVPTVMQTVGTKIPVFCIGGIKRENLPNVTAAGAKRVVIVSDLLLSQKIEDACQEAIANL